MHEHPSEEELRRFLIAPRSAASSLNQRIVRHLLSGCPVCLELLSSSAEGLPNLARLALAPEIGATPKPACYEQAFEQAERGLEQLLTIAGGPHRLRAAFALDREIREEELSGRLHSAESILRLIERSHVVRFRDPRQTLHFAHLAHLSAQSCSSRALGRKRLSDLQSRAWSHYANALRVNGRIPEAVAALAEAEDCRARGSGDRELLAFILGRRASVLVVRREIEDAIAALQDAERHHREDQRWQDVATVRVQRSAALLSAGEPEQAALVLSAILPRIDPRRDPELHLAARHNLMRCYVDLDRPEDALVVHCETRDFYRQGRQAPLILTRALWQEAMLLRKVGHLPSAERLLLRARADFGRWGLTLEQGMVSTELADLYREMGRPRDAERTIPE